MRRYLYLAVTGMLTLAAVLGCARQEPDARAGGGAADASAPVAPPQTTPTATPTIPAGGPLPQMPVAPLRVAGACPFECCTYGRWTTSAATTVYASADDTASLAFTLPAGETVSADSGHVLLTRIGTWVTLRPVNVYSGPRESRRVPAGDTLHVLDYVGEGSWHVWYDGNVYEASADGALERPPGDTASTIERVREQEAQWWAHVTTSDGRGGWLWMERTPSVRGADACGA